MAPPTWQNPELRSLAPSGRYGRQDLDRIESTLIRQGTLAMRALPSGLFPAAAADSTTNSGYGNVWVRDNVHVAYAHYLRGDHAVARDVARGLLELFARSRARFEAIIEGRADPNQVMERPHVRFDGERMAEVPERWPHAQNDALGYALWLCATLAKAGVLALDAEMRRTMSLFPPYFAAIKYWEDEDSGHWEETRKQSASSIGTVVAGLEAFRETDAASPLADSVSALVGRGRAALDSILPSECTQPSPRQHRRYDAALLFLLYPLGVVRGPMAARIMSDIDEHLVGDHGVRRYPGDSYFAPDYEDRVRPDERTRDYSEDLATRDALLEIPGTEAQWCIFDPLISAYHGVLYRETGAASALERQSHHLNRALSQVDARWRCPELYYLRRGVRVAGPHNPLLWTQANLVSALVEMDAGL